MLRSILLAFLVMIPTMSWAQDTPLNWTGLDQLSRSERSWVKLDEEERTADIEVARAKLAQDASDAEFDTLFVHHLGGPFCGSGGCLLEVIHFGGDGQEPRTILQMLTDDVALGRNFENGMRNLRFGNGSVTWQWNGEEYEIR